MVSDAFFAISGEEQIIHVSESYTVFLFLSVNKDEECIDIVESLVSFFRHVKKAKNV